MKNKAKWIGGFIFGAVVLAVATIWRADTLYREWDSKDGTISVVVRKQWISSFIPAMPGQGGDAPGWVTVIDRRTGATLLHKRVSMVNAAECEIGEFKER
jgi:hypothetical protein